MFFLVNLGCFIYYKFIFFMFIWVRDNFLMVVLINFLVLLLYSFVCIGVCLYDECILLFCICFFLEYMC